jgi:catechol 2,3-dioxygenase-like lactoylglutathione lyase family enzyme/ketosteroid isomerase-like protein
VGGVTVADRLSEAFGRDDFEGMIAVLDPEVLWYGDPGSGEEAPSCTSRDEVRAWFEWHIQQGHRALPRIVGETPERIVVELNLQDAPGEHLHQVLTVREDRVVRIQDFPDRESAMREAGIVEEARAGAAPEAVVARADAKLGQTIPALPVRDAAAAVEFYRDRLGFEVLHHDGGFAVLARDEAVLHLWEAADEGWRGRESLEKPVRSGAESFLAGTASCRIAVAEVDDLYGELAQADVLHPVSKGGVEDTDFGSREFATLDLDGNLLTFFKWRDPS